VDGNVHHRAALHGDQLSRLAVADAVSQPREGAGLGNDEGDGADARAAVADVDPRGIPPFRFGIGGGQAGLVLGAVTGVEKLQGTAVAFLDQPRQLGGARDGSSVDLQNDIVTAKPRRFRGDDGAVSVFDGMEPYHDHALGEKFHTEGHTARVELLVAIVRGSLRCGGGLSGGVRRTGGEEGVQSQGDGSGGRRGRKRENGKGKKSREKKKDRQKQGERLGCSFCHDLFPFLYVDAADVLSFRH